MADIRQELTNFFLRENERGVGTVRTSSPVPLSPPSRSRGEGVGRRGALKITFGDAAAEECSDESVQSLDLLTAKLRNLTSGCASSSEDPDLTASAGECTVFVIVGAPGRTATRRVYPAMWELFSGGLLPKHSFVVGYSGQDTSVGGIRRRCDPILRGGRDDLHHDDAPPPTDAFWDVNRYAAGSYEDEDQTSELATTLDSIEEGFDGSIRVFIMAAGVEPCAQFLGLVRKVWPHAADKTKVLFMESLFETGEAADGDGPHLWGEGVKHIDALMHPDSMSRMLTLRFANPLFQQCWHREAVAKVVIRYKTAEDDEFERDVLHSPLVAHLFHLLCIIAMEKPVSASAVDYQREKVRVLRAVKAVEKVDILLAERVLRPNEGILSKSNQSTKPTFLSFVAYVENERWFGVPFIFIAGESLDETKEDVSIVLKEPSKASRNLYPGCELPANELRISLCPTESFDLLMVTEAAQSEMTSSLTTLHKKPNQTNHLQGHILHSLDKKDLHHLYTKDEIELLRKILDPIWKIAQSKDYMRYKKGSKGPTILSTFLRSYGLSA